MANFIFQQACSKEISSDIQVMDWLKEAAIQFDGLLSVDKSLRDSDEKRGVFYLIKQNEVIYGVIFVIFSQQILGMTMTLQLLGGVNLKDWAQDLSDHLHKTAEQFNCYQFCYLGRSGFGKIFPELKEVARLYRKILKT